MINIIKCLSSKQISVLQDRLIFVEHEEDPANWSYAKATMQLGDSSLPITHIKTSSYKEIYGYLSKMKRKFPAPLLRKLKEALYELVLTNDKKNRIYVSDINSDIGSEEVEFVIGVGAINAYTDKGYDKITTADIIEDLLFSNKKFDSHLLLTKTIAQMPRSSVYMPVYKYLRACKINSYDDYSRSVYKIDDYVDISLEKYRSSQYLYKCEKYEKSSVQQLAKSRPFKKSVHYISYIDADRVNRDDLIEYLSSNFEVYKTSKQQEKTAYKKLVCLYDRLTYGWT